MTDDSPHRPDRGSPGATGSDRTDAPMPLSRFQALLDAYGAAAGRWPEEERTAALALLARSPAARQARDAAARLDALLNRVPAEPPSAALVERVLAAAPVGVPAPPAARGQHRRGIGRRLAASLGQVWPGAAAWQPVTALATALLLGLAVGYTQPPFDPDAASALDGEGMELLAFGVVSEPEVSP